MPETPAEVKPRPFFKADAVPHQLHVSGGQTFPRPAATRLAAVFIDRQEGSAVRTAARSGERTRDKIAGHTPARRVGAAGTFPLIGTGKGGIFSPTAFFKIFSFGTREAQHPFTGLLFVPNGYASAPAEVEACSCMNLSSSSRGQTVQRAESLVPLFIRPCCTHRQNVL